LNAVQPFVITLDGPAAAGKSSVGLGVARALGFGYFDTGLLYRALTWLALEQGAELNQPEALTRLVDELDVELDPLGRIVRHGTDITDALHTPEISAAVSPVSAHAAVREALRPVQRSLIRPPGLVMAGRDIGTIIVPDAPLKIWLNASLQERARRRAAQTGEPYADVLDGMQRRDEMDASRDVAPMAPAKDAVIVDTDGVALDLVIGQIVDLARRRGAAAIAERA
jgi:cytidylate kinase